PLVGVGRGQGARRTRIVRYDGDHAGSLAGVARLAVLDEHALRDRDHVRADQATGVPVAADQGHLRDDALDASVNRPNDQHVGATVARAPDADPVLVHLRKRAGVGNGVTAVGNLPPGVDVLTGLAIAGAEAAIVEDKGPE